MKSIKLNVVSSEGIEATIQTDVDQDGADDYYAIVSIKGFIEQKKIYGIDPIQSFTLGMTLIEKLTTDKRLGEDGGDPMTGASWRIEVAT